MMFDKGVKRQKNYSIIVWTIIAVVFIASVVLLIVTSKFSNDLTMTKKLVKANDIDFFRGWSSYFIIDGNMIIISVLVPLVFVLIESLYKYLKVNKPNSFGARHYKDKRWFYIVIGFLFIVFTFLYMADKCFSNNGFGKGFVPWDIIGWEYLIPIYVVSCLVNIGICFGLLYYVGYDLSKRDNFLNNKEWKKVIVIVIMAVLSYAVILILKNGFGRPRYQEIYWNDWLNKIKNYDATRYEKYINSNHNRGWHDGSGRNDLSFPDDFKNWPWWKIGKGYFSKNKSLYNHLPSAHEFPSGHMGMVGILLASLWYVLFYDSNNKREIILKWTFIGIGTLYFLNLYFSFGISARHWISDLSFSLIWDPIAFAVAWLCVNGVNQLMVLINRKANKY